MLKMVWFVKMIVLSVIISLDRTNQDDDNMGSSDYMALLRLLKCVENGGE